MVDLEGEIRFEKLGGHLNLKISSLVENLNLQRWKEHLAVVVDGAELSSLKCVCQVIRRRGILLVGVHLLKQVNDVRCCSGIEDY